MEATRITTKEIQKTQELIDFIKKSPSCYHVIHNIAAELEEAGYEQLNEAKEWTLHKGGRYFVTRNQSSLPLCFRKRLWEAFSSVHPTAIPRPLS